jgi:hypothetical protein
MLARRAHMASPSTPSFKGVLCQARKSLPPAAELVEAVRHWVHFDNLAESLNKQVANVRTLRNQYETKVLELMESQGLKKASLKITNATLTCAQRTKPTDLTWSFLEEQLHAFYKSTGQRDATAELLTFLQQQRGGKTVEYLKKTSASSQTQTQQPPSSLVPSLPRK